jgi:transcriptional regulator with XRE-family HTH domain
MSRMENFNSIRAVKCREDLNLSQSYMADLLNISTSDLADIESGKVMPSSDIVELMVKIYGCSKNYLLSETSKQQFTVLTRNGNELSEFDQNQVLEFLAFQKVISKQVYNEH